MNTLAEAYEYVYHESYTLKAYNTKDFMAAPLQSVNSGNFGYIQTTPKFRKFAKMFIDDPEQFPTPKILLDAGWPANEEYSGLMDVVGLLEGEFIILVPEASKSYNTKQIGRAIMQLFESYSESELYVGAAGFPQTLEAFEAMATYLRDEGFISVISKPITQLKSFRFIFGDPQIILDSFKDIQNLG